MKRLHNQWSIVFLSSKYIDATGQIDKVSDFLQNPPEDRESEFADYSWANIGSFDDLDRIFR